MVKVSAHAKLNFTLDITGQEGGYHLIDSLVSTIDLNDRIVARKRKDRLITVAMHGMGSESIPPGSNYAFSAGEAFVRVFGTQGADLTVYKNIPIGAGLGGSSADAAGVLRALSVLYGAGTEEELKTLADGLGSDTGYLLTGGLARLGGRGERVESLPFSYPFHALLLLPPRPVSTAECYRKSDEFPRGAPRTQRAVEDLAAGNAAWAEKLFSNDLFAAACALEPDVGRAAEELSQFSPLAVNMTGSGSGVYALFGTRELCEWAKSRYRGTFRAVVVENCDVGAR